VFKKKKTNIARPLVQESTVVKVDITQGIINIGMDLIYALGQCNNKNIVKYYKK